ncbi:MAG: matrixin family metalloprotease [Pseudohongiella sp.]|nr:matrixin family metalloprotease [Pseudohongiella sp.]
MKRMGAVVAALVFMIFSVTAWSFNFLNGSQKWSGASTRIYTGLGGTAPGGITWSVALRQAAQEWNEKTDFTFDISGEYRDPCAGTATGSRPDFLNGVGFGTTVCGEAFNSTTIAVTVSYRRSNILGSLEFEEADIVFNSNLNFDVYDGPLRINSNNAPVYDFRRVALHEFGHVIGLDHDDRQAAIMNSRIGSLSRLQQDDIAGVNALYAGINNCSLSGTGFGWQFGGLQSGDCRIQQLMSGGTDTSFVDIYTLDVANDLTVKVDVQTDGRLNAVLFLATEKLGNFKVDEGSAGNCVPSLQSNLPAGKYVILVNTYTNTPPCNLASTGNYRLSVSYTSAGLLTLGGRQSFKGGISEATYYGGVTVNGGLTYGNRVGPNQPFDVRGRINIDPRHQGQPGFLAVAAITHTGEILVKNQLGEFVAYQPEQQLIPVTQRKILTAVEDIEIFKQFVASSIGISSISVDFLIGYGLDSNPDELYYHQQPINLLVE